MRESGGGGCVPRTWIPLSLCALMTACASAPEERKAWPVAAPLREVSAAYSEFDMRVQLLTAAEAPACGEAECGPNRDFDQQVALLSQRLVAAARQQQVAAGQQPLHFEFLIADKRDAGTVSNASGKIVIYRGVHRLALDDGALAFVLACEMGHVMAGHHEDNVATTLAVTIAAQVLFPVLNLFRGTAAAVSANATSTALTSSAASFAGSRILQASDRPQQVRAAEDIALHLLVAAGWNVREVSDQLERLPAAAGDETAWNGELRNAALHIASLMQGPLPERTETASAAPVQVASGAEPRVAQLRGVSTPF